jgi:hypothetical protein
MAHRFNGHRLAAVREWAVVEAQSALAQAEWWQQKTEEENIR